MKSFFTVALAVLPAIIFAQSNYHPGYVLKNNGDTLKGFIDYREWAYSPLSIEFKASEASKEVLEFNPTNIKGFQITGFEMYKSYSGMISMDRNTLPDLPDGLDTSKKQDDVFLQQLETGKNITLYTQSDTRKTRFFIAEADGLPVELKYYRYFAESKSTEKADNLYIGQFMLYIYKFNGGDKNLLEKAQQLLYGEANIEEMVAQINGTMFNKGAENPDSKIRKGPGARVIAGAGVNIVSTKNNITLSSTSTLPEFTIGIDVFTNPNVQQFIFRFEAALSFVNASFAGSGASGNVSFDQTNFSLVPQVIFNVYNTDNFKVYVNAGMSFNFSSYSSDSSYPLDDYWSSIPLQVGVVLHKRAEIFLQYTNYTRDFYLIAEHSTCIGIKYFFP